MLRKKNKRGRRARVVTAIVDHVTKRGEDDSGPKGKRSKQDLVGACSQNNKGKGQKWVVWAETKWYQA